MKKTVTLLCAVLAIGGCIAVMGCSPNAEETTASPAPVAAPATGAGAGTAATPRKPNSQANTGVEPAPAGANSDMTKGVGSAMNK